VGHLGDIEKKERAAADVTCDKGTKICREPMRRFKLSGEDRWCCGVDMHGRWRAEGEPGLRDPCHVHASREARAKTPCFQFRCVD
jgi:hypothetical protein